MAKLDISQIEHIAKLSKLRLSKEEKELYSQQLSSVLEYVEQLQEIDTENVESTANVTGLSNVWREDGFEKSDVEHSDIAKNAPEFKNDSFVVPNVFLKNVI